MSPGSTPVSAVSVRWCPNSSMTGEKNDQIMIGILSQVTEIHNSESIHHISRVQRITSILLERLCQKTDIYGLSGMDRYLITTASALHDIGKVAIDDRILTPTT